MKSSLKILSVVEATTVNAVGKLVLDFDVTARELAASGTDFPAVAGSVVTFDRSPNARPNEFILAAKNAGVELDVIPERRRFDLSVLPALQRVAADRGPDVIVTNSVKSHFLLWRTRLWQKYPWVAFHHGYTTTDSKMRLYNRFDRWSLPKADVVVTVCNAFARELTTAVGLLPEQIRVQHNSIRPGPTVAAEEVLELRERLGISARQRVILSVGRLSKEKAHSDLIVAFKALYELQSNTNCKLVIVGDGPERQSLTNAARESGLDARIIFTGQLGEVGPYYAMADVFVLSSHSEGSPNVLLEAMAANLPVVATCVGGVPEIVENEKSALLVPAKDPTALATAIARILSDSSLGLRLAEDAAAVIAKNHTPEQYVHALIKIYDEAISLRGYKTTD